jgi:hypothetical protein
MTPVHYHADAREREGYEVDAQLIPLASLDQAALTISERVFLEAAKSLTRITTE